MSKYASAKKIHPNVQDTICNYCRWAKDRVNNTYVNGCYCVHYGYIISKRKERCLGHKPIPGGARKETEK